MAGSISVERMIEQRDIDAALYLLGRMLGVEAVDESLRRKLLELKLRLQRGRHLSEADRHDVVAAYREVIG